MRGILLVPFFCVGCLSQEKYESKANYKNGEYRISMQNKKEFEYSLDIYFGENKVYEDTIFSRTGQVRFEDLNGDGIKDVLVNANFDARSNEMFHLYLLFSSGNTSKVENFQNIKNPQYLTIEKVIESYVVSSTPYVQFYKIRKKGELVENNKVIVYDFQDGSFANARQKGLSQFLKDEN